MSSEVDTFIAELQHPQKREVRLLRDIILGAGAAIREGIKWKAPSFRTTQDFATLHLRAKEGVQVILFLGVKPRPDANVRAEVADPESLLAWRSADRAIVTFRDAADIEAKRAAFVEILRCESVWSAEAAPPLWNPRQARRRIGLAARLESGGAASALHTGGACGDLP